MKLREIFEKLPVEASVLVSSDIEVRGAYTSDLLSDVIANSQAQDVWITLQVHQNIVAVASLRELSAIVVTGGHKADPDTLEKAREKGVNILTTKLNSFEFGGRLYQLLHGS